MPQLHYTEEDPHWPVPPTTHPPTHTHTETRLYGPHQKLREDSLILHADWMIRVTSECREEKEHFYFPFPNHNETVIMYSVNGYLFYVLCQ